MGGANAGLRMCPTLDFISVIQILMGELQRLYKSTVIITLNSRYSLKKNLDLNWKI